MDTRPYPYARSRIHTERGSIGRCEAKPRRFTTKAAWALALLLLTALLAGCTQTSASSSETGTDVSSGRTTVVPLDEGTPKDGGKLVIGLDAEPAGFDPATSQYASQSHAVASSMVEAVMAFEADRTPKPYLASSVEPSDLAAKWTIKLKPNIKFHDGAKLDAEAVKANLEAQRQGLGTIALKVIDSVVVTGELSLEVNMTQPWASFPAILAGQ